jgi:AcrR family transcriptional regulator
MAEKARKPRRHRRTRENLERDVQNAVTTLIEEVGFANVTLTAVAQRAKIEASVFYRRYENLDDLFDEYTRKYDYWLAGITELLPADLNEEDSLRWIMRSMITALYKNRVMQQLLIWELSEDNEVTRRTATLREKINESLIGLLETRFANSGWDMNVVVSMLIGGVYYLILHRTRSTFCNVDFGTKKGKDRLLETVDQMIQLIFADINKAK